VRHLYDLHVICVHYDPAEVAALAREIMPYDAEAFGNQLPAYRVHPMAELRGTVPQKRPMTLTREIWSLLEGMSGRRHI
jgi:hypothetical protein